MIWLAIGLALVAATGTPAASAVPGVDLNAVLADDHSVRRLRDLVSYVEGLRPEEIAGVARKVEAGHGPGRDNLLQVLAGRWVEVDAKAALAEARGHETSGIAPCIFDVYYGTWAQRDPAGAMAALQALPQDVERGEGTWAVVYQIGDSDPAQADALLRSVHWRNLDGDYFIYWHWAEKDPASATQLLLRKNTFAKVGNREEAQEGFGDYLLEKDPKAAANWVAQLPPGKLHDEVFKWMAQQWARVDPQGALAWLKSLPAAEQGNEINEISTPEYSTAGVPTRIRADASFAAKSGELAAILKEPDPWRELLNLLAFVDGLSAADFPQALDQLRNGPETNRDEVMDVLVARWVDVDAAGAMKSIPQARAIHDLQFATRFLTDLFDAWSQRDPDAAFAAARAMPQGYEHFEVLRSAFAGLARENPVKAYATFRELKDPNSHMLITSIFTEWAATDLSAATRALPDEGHVSGAVAGIVAGLMRQGPKAAIAWATNLPAGTIRGQALREVANQWSQNDPAAATAWLEGLPSFSEKSDTENDVALDWANRDPMEALRHAEALPEGKKNGSLLMWGLAQLTYDDANAAARWVEQLPEGPHKKRSFAVLIGFWNDYDAPAAAAYVSSLKKDELRQNNIEGVAQAWSYLDPAAAAKWVAGFPDGPQKAAAVAKIAEGWERDDPTAAAAWVDQLPEGILRDGGAKGISNGIPDYAEAEKWAESIRDPKMRNNQLFVVFEAWMRRGDWAEATAAVKSSSLSDADKKKLLAKAPILTVFPYGTAWKTTLTKPPGK